MKKYLDPNTRINLRFYFHALSNAFCLQRKKWYGWKTVSWIYPSVIKDKSIEYIITWLEWDEMNNKSEYKTGIKILKGDK